MSQKAERTESPSSTFPGSIHIGGEMFLKLFDQRENFALIVTDKNGIISRWNSGASKIFKYSPEEAVGKHISLLYPLKGNSKKEAEEEFKKVIAKGEKESTLLLSRKEGSHFYAKCFLFPFRDDQQRVKGYVKVIQTLHDPLKDIEAEGLLANIDHVLTSSLNYRTIIKEVISLCVPSIADWVYVDQLLSNGNSKRIEVAHADPSKAWLAKETQNFTATTKALNYPQARAQYKKRSVFIPEVTEEIIRKSAQSKDHERVMKAINPNSLIAIPLISGGKTLGTLTFMVGESGRTYSKKDLKLTEEIARRTALVLDNALLYEQAKWEKKRLQSLFTEAPVGIAILSGQEFRVELANPSVCKIWGKGAEEILGQAIFDVLPETEEQGFRKLLEQVRQSGQPFVGKETPVQFNRAGKSELLYLNFVYQPIIDQEGNFSSVMAVAMDVSEQVQARQRAEESEEKLRIALDAGNMGTWHLNLEDDTSSRSLRHDRIFGYSTLLPKWGFEEFSNHLHPEDRKPVREKFEEAFKTGHLTAEARIRRTDGELRWIAVKGQVFFSNHKPSRISGVVTDITEVVSARQEAQENAERFRMLLETIPTITWTHLQDGSVSFFNQRWYEYTGLTAGQSMAYGWKEVIHPDDLPISVATVTEASVSGKPFEMENRFKRGSDGMYRWHLVRALPVRNESGDIILWVGTSTDIHDQKVQSTLLQKQNKKLDDLNKYLDNFVHTVAHDLRSPVANIIGLLQLLDLNKEETRNINIVEKLKTSVDRLDNTLKGMIQLIELQSISENSTELLNIREILEDVLNEFTTPLQEIQHSLSINLENCPSVRFTKPYLLSIFRNLISNSIKYRQLEQPLEISIHCRNEDEFIIIHFQDNGIGIDLQKHAKNLFKPFFRFTQQASGKGIGLHLINNMIQRHGGKVEIESKAREGTTFKLYLKG